ncbi:MAG TPA: aminopeptidase [Candidatus Bathyarchaeia archaeon]|nr:aminopeptidase [Candidatus Bathyarchaeia archaeon]
MFQNLSIMKGARVAVETCMKTQSEETVLVVTDTHRLRIAEAFAYAAASIGAKTVTTIMEPAQEHAKEPPKPVAEAMKAAQVVLIPTTKSLSHTDARRAATKAGARIASMPGITEDMMRIGGLTANYQQVAALTDKVTAILGKAKTVKITTPSGTDLTMSVEKRAPLPDTGLYHKTGDWGNLPAGEVCLAPVEGTTNGVWIIDSMGSIVTQPLKVTLKDGWAKRFDGPDASKLENMLKSADKNAYNIGELGIGTNSKARITGNILEDEKVLGTVHIALGDNTSYAGGHTKSKIHLDGILFQPTVKVDSRLLMQKGKLLVS